MWPFRCFLCNFTESGMEWSKTCNQERGENVVIQHQPHLSMLCLTDENVHTTGKILLRIIHMLSDKAGFLLGDKQNIFSFGKGTNLRGHWLQVCK